MNNNIKLKIEKYVAEEIDYLNQLSPTEVDYNSIRTNSVKNINTLVDLLQKEDINEGNLKFNDDKIKNEFIKNEKEHELNLKKLECEVKKNKDNLDLEKEKINKGYEIDYKKVENDIAKIDNEMVKINKDYELNDRKIQCDIAKIDNEMVKINKDYELNDRKIQCDIDKMKNDIIKINQDYEIDNKKIQIEIKNNEETLHLENRKIDSAEIKNNSDSDLKREELNINTKRDIELRTDRIIKVIIDGVIIIVPTVFYNVWMKKGFEFEETGTFTSNTFKNMFIKFKLGK